MACLGEVRFVFSIGESPSPPEKRQVSLLKLVFFAISKVKAIGVRPMAFLVAVYMVF